MIQRAQLLMQQSRYDLAEQELRRLLGDHPEAAPAHAMLAHSLMLQQKGKEAEDCALRAIQLGPEESYCHFTLALVKAQNEDLQQARQAVEEAIRLDPEVTDYFGLRASIFLAAQHWQEALDSADEGLAHDPAHQGCLNNRATALVKLNRHEEAHQTIADALREDPEDESTHANLGWNYLHKGKHREALEHFSEALRLDPNLSWAHQGLVEALKARYLVYRWVLGVFLWMSTLSRRARIGLVVGTYLTVRVMNAAAGEYPQIAPYVLPVIIAYTLFVLLTWIATPLFNLLLLSNHYGRHALSQTQRAQSYLFGAMLLGALCCAAVGALGHNSAAYVLAFHMLLLVIPSAGIFCGDEARIYWRGFSLVLGMAMVAAVATGAMAIEVREVVTSCTIVNLLALVLYTWLGALLGLRIQKV